MNDKRSSAGLWLAMTLLMLLLLGAYGAAYVLRSEVIEIPAFAGTAAQRIRMYRADWEAIIFRPAARVESVCTGAQVSTMRTIIIVR